MSLLGRILPHAPGTEPLAAAMKACRTHFMIAAAFSALINILYLAPTLYMMQVYDRVVPTGGIATLVLITAIALAALATLVALDWLRGRLLVRAGLRLDARLAATTLGRVVDLPAKQAGNSAMRDLDNVRTAIAGQGATALLDAPWTPLYLFCCFLLHPAVGTLTLVGGVLLIGLAILNERDSRPKLKRAFESANRAYAAQESIAEQAEVVRALGMRQASIQRQIQQRETVTNQQSDAQFSGGKYSGLIKFLRMSLQSLSLGLAAFLAVKGQISAGAIIAASVLLSRAVAPVEFLVGAWPGLTQARTSWKALLDIFQKTAGVDRERTVLPPPRGRVSMENVTLRLHGTTSPQLQGINLVLEPGQMLGVIGPSGSGKTTLARLLAGAQTPSAGTIRLDGAEYDAREPDDLAKHIGYLPQNSSLFAGTIKENISRFQIAATGQAEEIDTRAVSAAMAAGAHDMIQKLPMGYDTMLGPFGAGVSAGQAQRIALARALYGDPALLVLDEPNSSLDHEGELALMAAVIAAAGRGAAVVIIAHRAGVLQRVDRLLTIKDGKVQLQGPREEVLGKLRTVAPIGRPS